MTIDADNREIEPVAVQRFAWGHFLAIVGGTVLIIATICAIATIAGKQEASFSSNDPPMAIALG